MEKDGTRSIGRFNRIDNERIQDHIGKIVRGSVEDNLNALLEGGGRAACGRGPLQVHGGPSRHPLW